MNKRSTSAILMARPTVLAAILALAAAPLAAQIQSRDQTSTASCGDPNPDISIAVCSGLIQSKRASGASLGAIYVERGIAYMALQDFDRAIGDFTQAIKLDPKNVKAFANRGAAHSARQEWDGAIQDFGQVIALDRSAHAYADRAGMYLLAGQADRAIQDFSEAIKMDPGFVDAILTRGLTLASVKRCADAIPDFTRVIELKPDESKAYLERGICEEMGSHDDLALQDLSAHLSIDARSFTGLEHRAGVLFRLGQLDRAFEDYKRALELTPNSPRALFGRGVVRRLKGDVSGGNEDIEAATALRPAIADEMGARGIR